MPKTSKKKKAAPPLVFYKAPHLEESTSVGRRYSEFSTDPAGNVSHKTSKITINVDNIHPIPSGSGVQQGAEDDRMVEDDVILSTDPPLDAEYLEHLETVAPGEKLKRIRAKGDECLQDFVPQADKFLEELIGLDSRGSWPTEKCAICHLEPGEYQCMECWGRQMMCSGCILHCHTNLFLHRLQKWNGVYFDKVSLKGLGLRKQLGHPPGEKCLNPERCPNDDFIIIHTNGLHEVGLDFCGCGRDNQLHTVQLLRARLFPATIINPKTAATNHVLDLFEIQSYESKMSTFEFYYALSRLTDNTGMNTPKDRYPSFLRMIHEWRHLMMLKRAGRGHDPAGIVATAEGECAVLCPACPQPGKNMHPDWKSRPEHLRYLDTLFISIDANFRLKRKNVSSHMADPGLSAGFSYFVEETKYKEHLKNYINEAEPKSSCSRHDAVNLSETKPGQGHAATGVGAVVCSRHDMKRPSAVAQLQRGERYCNMDYIFYMTMKDSELEYVVVSYDIACQWFINLLRRMAVIDSSFFLFNGRTYVRFLVPKFHLPAHIAKCRTRFSFNFAKNVGRTEGESPERGWVSANKLAPSTKEMGPGSCRDTLDYNFGDENHKKVIGLGDSLCRKVMAAARNMAEHVIAHSQLESTLTDAMLDEWTIEIERWEEDPSQPNPFEREITGPTQASVRRQLAEDEKHQLEQGRDFSLDDTVTPSVLISTGIDLESEQRAFKVMNSKIWDHSLDRQHTKLLLRGNTIMRKIEAWSKYQLLYLPGVAKLRETSLNQFDHSAQIKAHEVPLWLPSQIGNQIVVSEQLRVIEFELRLPQAQEALDELRSQLQLRAHVFKFKDRFVRGQGANTRARNTLDAVQAKVDAAAAEYRASYAALDILGTILRKTLWREELLLLRDEDIRDLSEGKAKQSEGRRDISWIWRKQALHRIDKPAEGHLRDGVRVEWAKSRARAHRFTEEVSLLSEEMMRVLRFFEWKAQEWTIKADTSLWLASLSQMRVEGLTAYANRQAAMFSNLGSHFQSLWAEVPGHIMRMQAIIEDPNLALPGEFDSTQASKSKRH